MDWKSTHLIPDGGTRAWVEPHPEAQELARLDGGTAVRVIEERGAWAHVETADGSAAWVDGRRLEESDQWEPTHRVPADGTRAWAEPHPEAGELPRFDGDLAVQVVEERGAWAHVETADGRTAWVDGRRLAGAAAPVLDATVAITPQQVEERRIDTPQPTGQLQPTVGTAGVFVDFGPVSIAGAALMVLAAGFPWFRPVLGNVDGWDLPLLFAVDSTAGSSVISYALALIVLAGGGLLLGRRAGAAWQRAAGVVAIVLSLAAMWQLMGFAADLSNQGRFDVFGDVLSDGLHAGPYLAILGGLGLMSGK